MLLGRFSAVIDNFNINTIAVDGISPVSDLAGIVHYKKIGMKAYGQNYGRQLKEVECNREFLKELEVLISNFVEKEYTQLLYYKKQQHLSELKSLLIQIGVDKESIKPINDGFEFELLVDKKFLKDDDYVIDKENVRDNGIIKNGEFVRINNDILFDKVISKIDPAEPDRKFDIILDHYLSNNLPFNINCAITHLKI